METGTLLRKKLVIIGIGIGIFILGIGIGLSLGMHTKGGRWDYVNGQHGRYQGGSMRVNPPGGTQMGQRMMQQTKAVDDSVGFEVVSTTTIR